MSKRIDRAAIQKLGLAFLDLFHAPISRSHVVMRPEGTSCERPPRRIFDFPALPTPTFAVLLHQGFAGTGFGGQAPAGG